MTARPRLTPHQRDTLRRLQRRMAVYRRPFPAAEVGSRAAVLHLEAKGYVTLSRRPGPRGGEHVYVESVST